MKANVYLFIFIILVTTSVYSKEIGFDNHWIINHVKNNLLLPYQDLYLNHSSEELSIALKRIDKTDYSIFVFPYKRKKHMEESYFVISLANTKNKKVLDSYLLKIPNKPVHISIDTNSYRNISKGTIFGITIESSNSESIDFMSKKDLFVYKYNDEGIEPLFENFNIYEAHSQKGIGCSLSNEEHFVEIPSTVQLSKNNKIFFSGYFVTGGRKVRDNQNIWECEDLPVRKGKYTVALSFIDKNYRVTSKKVYVNNTLFNNIYQISKITGNSLKNIMRLNKQINPRNLIYGEAITLP